MESNRTFGGFEASHPSGCARQPPPHLLAPANVVLDVLSATKAGRVIMPGSRTRHRASTTRINGCSHLAAFLMIQVAQYFTNVSDRF